MIQARRYTGAAARAGRRCRARDPPARRPGLEPRAARRRSARRAAWSTPSASGLDPGGAALLARYERWRRFDSLALIAITDGLNRLFGNDLLPLRLARELGLGLVERIGPLKQFFMRHAMGLLGDLPRLMRGEAL